MTSTGSIVVGTDGSETASEAVRHAAELARATGATVHVVSAFQPGAVRTSGGTEVESTVGPDATVEALLQQAAGILTSRGVTVEVYARKGDPAEALIDVAEQQGADVIIVGNKGMQGARRFLLGSVPDKISHHAPCSVLIVRTG